MSTFRVIASSFLLFVGGCTGFLLSWRSLRDAGEVAKLNATLHAMAGMELIDAADIADFVPLARISPARLRVAAVADLLVALASLGLIPMLLARKSASRSAATVAGFAGLVIFLNPGWDCDWPGGPPSHRSVAVAVAIFVISGAVTAWSSGRTAKPTAVQTSRVEAGSASA